MSAANATAAADAVAELGAAVVVASSAAVPPPLSNTGVDRTKRGGGGPLLTLGVGWLQGTLRTDVGTAKSILTRHIGGVKDVDHGSKWYARMAKVGTLGSVISWHPRGLDDGHPRLTNEVFFAVTQSDLDQLGIGKTRALVRELQEFGVHWTRIDVYFDDPERVAMPREVLRYFTERQVNSRMRGWRDASSNQGETVYLGSKDSDVLVRVYDKDAEQRAHGYPGESRGIRWEVQAREDWRLRDVVQHIILADDPGLRFARWLVYLVDFRRRRNGQAHGERGERLAFYRRLLGQVVRAGFKAPQKVATLSGKIRWIEDQVAPTLALVLAAKGGAYQWLGDLVRDGRARVRAEEWELVAPKLRPRQFAVAGY